MADDSESNDRRQAQGQLKLRTKEFALRVIRLVQSLPASPTANVIGSQLLRSGTAVGANYRAACRARSAREFCAKLGIVEEETDESAYWMELLIDTQIIKEELLVDLLRETDEILAMVVASIRRAKRSRKGGP